MPSEFDLIQRYFKWPVTNTLLGIGDDAAVIAPNTEMELAISTDCLVAGQHFSENTDPYKLGYKSLAVNLSDMAAMGAVPRWATLSLTLPHSVIDHHESWLGEFSKGFHALAQEYQVALIGGDTASGPLNISVHIIGEVKKGRWLRRSGAQPGDDIWVSGCLGDAALALKHQMHEIALTDDEVAYCLPALDTPTARVALGQRLIDWAHSAIDISDGLMADLGHILSCSARSATIELQEVPGSAVMKRYLPSPLAVECLMTGGDDYELCFTASPKNRSAIRQIEQELQVPLTIIGEIKQQKMQKSDLIVYDSKGEKIVLEKKGYDHFAA
ncbi:MAG: thiamine-phosphate kinase [Nitrosomonas sp.]|nr:thiamine-phosphate kinase [Nitrosomonas sp.]MCW5607284.1 thiamine-phosphate kinase [Nitrosomonas sp.]